MPDISKYFGILMADIASINGQDVPSGGAGSFNPVTGEGTYEETIPTSGLIKYGAVSRGNSPSSNDSLGTFTIGNSSVINIQSDVNARHQVVLESKSDFAHLSYGRYAAFGITQSGQLWEIGSSSSYMQGEPTTSFQQITGIGDSDTGWSDVSCSYDGVLAINSGKLYYIGANTYGHAGTGNQTASYGTFTQVGVDSDWQSVQRCRQWSMATKGTNNVLYTCGRNFNYQTGQNTSSGNTTSWTAINDDNFTNTNVSFIGGNYDGGILIRSNGECYGWGDEDNNERFGLNSSSNVQKPTAIGSVGGSIATDWATGALGMRQCMLINTSGELFFAGEGGYYTRGDGSNSDAKSGNFVQIGTDTDFEKVMFDGAGMNSSVMWNSVVQKGSKLYASGYNKYGNMVDSTDDIIQTRALINANNLASGNVWTLSFNHANYLQPYVAAIY